MKQYLQIKKNFAVTWNIEGITNINIEDITNIDYKHVKSLERFWTKRSWGPSWFARSKWGVITNKYIWKLLQKKYIETYELDLAQYLSVPGLVWQAYLKKTKIEFELLTNIDMLQMVKKESEAEYVMQCIICKNK